MTRVAAVHPTGSFETRLSPDRAILTLLITGHIDTNSTGRLWRQVLHVLEQSRPVEVVIDASDVSYCDGAGAAFFVKLQQHQAGTGGHVTIRGLKEEFRRLLDLYGDVPREAPTGKHREPLSLANAIERADPLRGPFAAPRELQWALLAHAEQAVANGEADRIVIDDVVQWRAAGA